MKLLDTLRMPIGKDIKKKLDEYISTHVAEPAGRAGYEDTGAALSAVLSATGELLIPDNLAEAAIAVVPGAKLLKSGTKGMKKLIPGLERAGAIDYGAIRAAEEAKNVKKITKSEEAADTLVYIEPGTPVRVPAPKPKQDLYDYELKKLEDEAKPKLKWKPETKN